MHKHIGVDDGSGPSVAVCGGGLAGLTLALQLRQRVPSAKVTVIEAAPDPLPEAAHKVGESSVELGAHYFVGKLGLAEYMQERQLPKFGLRYFLGSSTDDLSDRMEFGPQSFPKVPSLQLDRGRLENDLRARIRNAGAELLTGAKVRSISLGEGSAPHEIMYEGAAQGTLMADWVVDASGRRRLLQSQLGLSRPSGHDASSAWWRVAGIRKVNDMLGAVGRRPWESRMQDKRWLSTNHIMGRGYWVWFIPLGSENTSIGIVTDENIHPLRTYNSHEKAMAWLREYEPAVARFISDDVPLDFKALKNFSYWSDRVFSEKRWACVGEAGVFADPFYSPGSDYIAWSNTFTCQMIDKWCKRSLTKEWVDQLNRTFLNDLGAPTMAYYRNMYQVFGSARVMVAKVHWDTCVYWAFPCQLFFQEHLGPEELSEYSQIASRLIPLNERVQRLLREWTCKEGAPTVRGRFVSYSSMPMFRQLQQELSVKKSSGQMLSDMWKYLERLEEFAQVLFKTAVDDVGLTSQLLKPDKELWVNALAIGLDPTRWNDDGLFDVHGMPRSLEEMNAQASHHIFRPIEA